MARRQHPAISVYARAVADTGQRSATYLERGAAAAFAISRPLLGPARAVALARGRAVVEIRFGHFLINLANKTQAQRI